MTTAILVDDELDLLEKFADMLEMYGIKVLDVGSNGKDAFELYKKHSPDIVLSDIQMPEYDGFFGLEKIREFDPDANVILVSADLREETEKRLLSMNASAIVYKPYDMKLVLSTIEGVVNGTLEMSEEI